MRNGRFVSHCFHKISSTIAIWVLTSYFLDYLPSLLMKWSRIGKCLGTSSSIKCKLRPELHVRQIYDDVLLTPCPPPPSSELKVSEELCYCMFEGKPGNVWGWFVALYFSVLKRLFLLLFHLHINALPFCDHLSLAIRKKNRSQTCHK